MHFERIISAQVPVVPFLYTDFSTYLMLVLLNTSQVLAYLIILDIINERERSLHSLTGIAALRVQLGSC